MLRRYEFVDNGAAPADGGSRPPELGPVPPGGLGGLLDTRPLFETRLHGYDRRQVDGYVQEAEEELAAARRAGDQLRARLAERTAELAELRGRPAPATGNPDLTALSERVREILRLASDEAAAMVQAATEEADQIVAEARTEAEARLAKTALMRDAVTAMVEQLHERAASQRAEAAGLLERARRQADELLRAAATERDRLAAEAARQRDEEAQLARQQRDSVAAVAAGRLLAVRDEVEDLRRQRDEARASLRRLADQVGQALLAAGAGATDERTVRSVPEPLPVPLPESLTVPLPESVAS
jgi:cell division septum initiation protein DivIVA